jgi:cyclic di-GMP phosphodiesterase Gmr
VPTPSVDVEMLGAALARRTGALILLVEPTGRICSANEAAARAAGLPSCDLVGADVEALVTPRDVPDFRRALLMSSRGHDLPEREYRVGPADGDMRAIAWSITMQPDVRLLCCVGVDVTATRHEFEVVRSRAVTDALTGLPNRAGLLEQLEMLRGSGASVVFCDLNGFKAVNDTLGHSVGDAVLVQVARRLRRTVRGEDFVARLGGDEFIVVVPPDPTQNFDILGRRLLRAMDQPMMLPGGLTVTVGMSIGEAVLAPGADIETVLNQADHDMYRMKSRQPTRAMASTPQS